MAGGEKRDRAAWAAEDRAAVRSATVYAEGSLKVTATLRPGGELEIYGQDLDAGRFHGTAGEEYEYALTVSPSDVGVVLAGLGAEPEADVLEVMAGPGRQIVERGEQRWLRAHGVEPQFWARRG